MLGEPRENAFLTCDFSHNNSTETIENALQNLGKVRTSTTFPSLCTAELLNCPSICGLETTVVLKTVDYHGDLRSTGGDPITAEIYSDGNNNALLNPNIVDKDDGTYDIHFR